MTWNVHGTFSLNPRFDLQGVIALIEKWSPDIAALQEIDSRGRDDNPFALLEDALAATASAPNPLSRQTANMAKC